MPGGEAASSATSVVSTASVTRSALLAIDSARGGERGGERGERGSDRSDGSAPPGCKPSASNCCCSGGAGAPAGEDEVDEGEVECGCSWGSGSATSAASAAGESVGAAAAAASAEPEPEALRPKLPGVEPRELSVCVGEHRGDPTRPVLMGTSPKPRAGAGESGAWTGETGAGLTTMRRGESVESGERDLPCCMWPGAGRDGDGPAEPLLE